MVSVVRPVRRVDDWKVSLSHMEISPITASAVVPCSGVSGLLMNGESAHKFGQTCSKVEECRDLMSDVPDSYCESNLTRYTR
jgi:hypothetical protein